VNHSSKLKLVIGQRNSLKSFMKMTHNKKQYRRLVAIFQKVKGRTYQDIVNEHGVCQEVGLLYLYDRAHLELETRYLQ
jgi:hypothetical protein